MSEIEKEPMTRDDSYFKTTWNTFQESLERHNITQNRSKEIAGLVRDAEIEITSEKATEVTKRAGLTYDVERPCFFALVQARREINEALQEGDLSPAKAKGWLKKLGLG